MNTKGHISRTSPNKSNMFVIFDGSGHFEVTNPTPKISSKYAIYTFSKIWITKFGPVLFNI